MVFSTCIYAEHTKKEKALHITVGAFENFACILNKHKKISQKQNIILVDCFTENDQAKKNQQT